MPNYATLLTYPIAAEIGNLYVPGINGNGPSTVERILTGYATDPVDNLITEFLPDVASRIHVRVIFVQRILNQIASDQTPLPQPSYLSPIRRPADAPIRRPLSPFNAESCRSLIRSFETGLYAA